jgi:hypothetical protein
MSANRLNSVISLLREFEHCYGTRARAESMMPISRVQNYEKEYQSAARTVRGENR